MLRLNIRGKSSFSAIQTPKNEPMNPKAIDARQPPLPYPAIDFPIAPQKPATTNKSMNEVMLIANFSFDVN
jgi:hypothetical protein